MNSPHEPLPTVVSPPSAPNLTSLLIGHVGQEVGTQAAEDTTATCMDINTQDEEQVDEDGSWLVLLPNILSFRVPPAVAVLFFWFHFMVFFLLLRTFDQNFTIQMNRGCKLPATVYQGIRNTSRQISFEFLFIKTCPPDKLHTRFRCGIE